MVGRPHKQCEVRRKPGFVLVDSRVPCGLDGWESETNRLSLTPVVLKIVRFCCATPFVMKASIILAYLLFQVPMVAAAQNDWEQHYSAARDIFLRAQCMDGYREPSKNSSQHPEPVDETIATQMDLAVAEFESALTGLSKDTELVGRKKLLTLHALERAQRLGHHPEAASKTWQSMYGSFDESGRFQLVYLNFVAAKPVQFAVGKTE